MNMKLHGLQRCLQRSPQVLHGRIGQLTCCRQPFIDRCRGMPHLHFKKYWCLIDSRSHRAGPLASNFSRQNRESTHITAASSDDSPISTTGKLLVIAFTCGALIKYGSLYSDVPFHPTPLAALLIVCSPPVGFAIWMALQGDSTKDSS